MARGFESKSVESQQADAQDTRQPKPPLTADERNRMSRKVSLQLALAQTQSELQAACRAGHRDMLRLKLDALKAELGSL
ncbi:MAG TPA: hypothetical protein VNJ02_15930 [Vicinamibacterales bacterium]|nr:hypothetical protein [Vicinamibacterales bacterium]